MGNDFFFTAITDLSATRRRKEIMRSGLCPPVGLAGVICPGLRYCNTECGSDAAAMCAITCTKQVAVPGQRAKVVPMLSTHAERSRFAESWHLAEGGGIQLSHF